MPFTETIYIKVAAAIAAASLPIWRWVALCFITIVSNEQIRSILPFRYISRSLHKQNFTVGNFSIFLLDYLE